MQDFLNHPAVQAGIAPFVLALVTAALLHRFRLGGLAVTAAFLTSAYFLVGFTFTPLSATRKIVLLSMAMPVAGLLVDFAFKPNRLGSIILAAAAAAAALWVFWPVLAQKDPMTAWTMGASALGSVAFMTGFAQWQLNDEPVRAGAAGLGLGIGLGATAILGASATYASFGIALGAGSGAFLILMMVTGKRAFAGATFTLPLTLNAGLVAGAAMILSRMPWHVVLVLALVPVAARVPVPRRAPIWLQAVICSLYALAMAAAAAAAAWQAAGTKAE